MITMPTVELKSGSFPAKTPQSWETCNNCTDEDIDSPHIVIYMDDGRLLAGPECGQWRFQYAVAGHLALAGVRIGPTDGSACELLDHTQIAQAVASLNAVGADVTVVLD